MVGEMLDDFRTPLSSQSFPRSRLGRALPCSSRCLASPVPDGQHRSSILPSRSRSSRASTSTSDSRNSLAMVSLATVRRSIRRQRRSSRTSSRGNHPYLDLARERNAGVFLKFVWLRLHVHENPS